jgi:hypothetical protein
MVGEEMEDKIFKTLLLIARPAAGKSEIIDFLKNCPLQERMDRFHVGNLLEVDDFPMLWAWFEEDDILSEMGYPRLHTNDKNEFLGNHLWNVLIRRICVDYSKARRDTQLENVTGLIEFSRGSSHGGYKAAFDHLSDEMLQNLAILYVDVSWEESLRKNRKRFNPDRPDSILEHGLTDDNLARLYKEVDWEEVSANSPEFLTIKDRKVPYVVFNNEDDVTTARGEALQKRLEEKLNRLWSLYKK